LRSFDPSGSAGLAQVLAGPSRGDEFTNGQASHSLDALARADIRETPFQDCVGSAINFAQHDCFDADLAKPDIKSTDPAEKAAMAQFRLLLANRCCLRSIADLVSKLEHILPPLPPLPQRTIACVRAISVVYTMMTA
jgi:hypothetical protein